MAFQHFGIVHFPVIPYLDVSDVWVGTGPDDDFLVYDVDRYTWGRRFQMVDYAHFAYWLIPTGGNVGTLKPTPLDSADDLVAMNSIVWRSDSGAVLQRHQDGGWYITNGVWGEGNRYRFNFAFAGCQAIPEGPWTDDDDPPTTIDYAIDWERWQSNRSGFATPTLCDLYVPATDHSATPPTGDKRVGVPSWTSPTLGTVYRSATATDSRGYYSYLFADGVGFAPNVWVPQSLEWHNDGKTYIGDIPVVGQSWTVDWYSDDGTEIGTETFNWNGWDLGVSTASVEMFEVGRLL